MKILFLNDYARLNGGAELETAHLRAALEKRGHTVRIFSTSAADNPAEPSVADYTCHGTTASYRTLLQTANPAAYRHLRRVLADFQPDVVHVRIFLTQLSPLILPLLRDVPSLYHALWYRPICPTGTKTYPNGSPCRDRWGAACYRHGCLPLRDWLPLMTQMRLWERWRSVFRLFLANSHALADQLHRHGFDPVSVLWNGLPPRPARPPLTSPPTVAFAGRLVPQKGADILLDAFALVQRAIPSAQLLIVGRGPQRPALQTQADRLGLRVRFTGFVAPAEMETLLAPAWIQVVPSRSPEGFGNVAAEAALRGTAVVASATGGLPEIVQHNLTGQLVPPGDAPALARALIELLADRALAERLGAAARPRALQLFTEDIMLNQLLAHYRTLATPPTPAVTPTHVATPAAPATPAPTPPL